jgi:SAM-dependent methyltransferase
MGWFKDFYETDYFKYYFEPKLTHIPAEEVDFILEQGKLNVGGARRPKVFDICCGVGRHARPLAARGCKVVGVDISSNNIRAAQEQAEKEGLARGCEFHLSDIRDYTPPKSCDAAINIFTSFGYFDSDEENAVIMAKAAESLKRGGRFILDVANREAVIANLAAMEKRGRRNNYVVERAHLDLAAGRMVGEWTFVRGKQRTKHTVSIRLYALHELVHMAHDHGLRFIEAFGTFAGARYSPKTPRCIFVAEKR